jgi:hypothetical protein
MMKPCTVEPHTRNDLPGSASLPLQLQSVRKCQKGLYLLLQLSGPWWWVLDKRFVPLPHTVTKSFQGSTVVAWQQLQLLNPQSSPSSTILDHARPLKSGNESIPLFICVSMAVRMSCMSCVTGSRPCRCQVSGLNGGGNGRWGTCEVSQRGTSDTDVCFQYDLRDWKPT